METEEIKKPLGEAVMALLAVDIPEREIRKGIPLVSFACHKGERDAVLVKALPLMEADVWPVGRPEARGEVLYRVDCLLKGKNHHETGILPEQGSGTFLGRLEAALEGEDTKAGRKSLFRFLKLHLLLCGLEELAGEELCPAVRAQTGEEEERYRRMDTVYYGEVLSYVEKGREILNSFSLSEAVTRLPEFPDRGSFMRRWYGERGDGRREKKDESGTDRCGRSQVAEPVPDETVRLA